MEIKKFIVLLVIIVVLSSFLTYTLHKVPYKGSKVAELDMDLIVTERKGSYGVNIDTDAIHFGKLPVRGGSVRHLNLTNNYNYDVFINIIKDDSILSSIVGISPDSFVLKPDENIIVDVATTVPKEFEPGNYTGKVKVMERISFFGI